MSATGLTAVRCDIDGCLRETIQHGLPDSARRAAQVSEGWRFVAFTSENATRWVDLCDDHADLAGDL